jgi:NTE family protein
MRHVETLLLHPEEDPAETALEHQAAVPGTLRSLLRVLGARGSRGGRLLSFLLFESPFTQALIDAGERDATRRRAEISAFLALDAEHGARID